LFDRFEFYVIILFSCIEGLLLRFVLQVGRKKRKAAREGPIKTEDAISKESLEGKRRTTPLVSQVVDKTEPVLKKKRRQRRPDAPHPIVRISTLGCQHLDSILQIIS
jgi:hypothetical protein